MHPHRSLFSQHPLAQLAVAFATGICVANCFPIKLSVPIGVVCSVLVLLLRKRLQLAGLILLVAVFFTGAVLVELERRSVSGSAIRNLVEQPISLTGWLDGPPEFARDLKKLLAGGYVIEGVLGFDLFPQTHHVETVVRFSRG